jgi:hypothetical protein
MLQKWEARDRLDEGAITAEQFEKKTGVVKTRAEKLEDRYANNDASGMRRFDLNASEAKRDFTQAPAVRADKKTYSTADIIKGSKSKQVRDQELAKRGGYQGPGMGAGQKKKPKPKPPKPSQGGRRDLGLR